MGRLVWYLYFFRLPDSSDLLGFTRFLSGRLTFGNVGGGPRVKLDGGLPPFQIGFHL